MADREKVIEGLEKVWNAFNFMEHELYADYVFDALALLKEQEKENSRINNSYLDLVKVASKQPDIVRCKDCEHLEHMYALDEKIGEEYYVCRIHPFTGRRTADWFCADGKRSD